LPEPLKAPRLWRKFFLGALLIALASATATSFAAFREVDKIVAALGTNGPLDFGLGLAEADAGTPQTIMLVGSDKRAKTARDSLSGAASGARSDTVILVRLDPARRTTALMSLPRDLKVRIPGNGQAKLNEAYSIGGPKLTLETIKELTGLRINHVINVDFKGFRQAVNAIDCVYADIDRRYFNDNSGPEKYATIDVKEGYQKLCGQDALDYVRYRHEDNDLVRSARQQDFIRQAKAQVGVARLVGDRDQLVRIFGRNTTSDLQDRASVLSVLKLLVGAAGQPITEVHFEGRIGESFVTASSASVKKLTRQFLGAEDTRGPRGEPRRPRARRRPRPERRINLEDASAEGRAQALQAVRGGARIPVYFPGQQMPGASYDDAPRVYALRGPDGQAHNAYRMVVRRDLVGEYYGVQGTAWRDPPILRTPSETREIGGRRFELHYDGDRLRLVAWRTRAGVYWISNTLLQSLSEKEMIAIARSTRAL